MHVRFQTLSDCITSPVGKMSGIFQPVSVHTRGFLGIPAALVEQHFSNIFQIFQKKDHAISCYLACILKKQCAHQCIGSRPSLQSYLPYSCHLSHTSFFFWSLYQLHQRLLTRPFFLFLSLLHGTFSISISISITIRRFESTRTYTASEPSQPPPSSILSPCKYFEHQGTR